MPKRDQDDNPNTDEYGRIAAPLSASDSFISPPPSYSIEAHTPYPPGQQTPASSAAFRDDSGLMGAWFRALMARSYDLMQILTLHSNGQFRTRFVNDGLEHMLGYTPNQFYQMSDTDYVHPDDLIHLRASIARCASTPGAREVLEYRVRHADGSWRDLEAHAVNCLNEPGVEGFLLTARDVTESRERENHLLGRIASFAALLSQVTDALRVIRADGQVQVASGRLNWLFGDATRGLDLEALLHRTHPDDQERVQEGVKHALQGTNERVRLGFRARSPMDEWRYIELELRNCFEDLLIEGLIITGRDLTERKLFDTNTRLPSRTLFLDRVERLLHRREHNPDEEFAVLVLEADRFNKVTDGLGASVGERLLKTIGSRLMVSVRPSDSVGRLDRDKFTILLHGLRQPADIARICQRVHQSVEQPCFLGGHRVYTTVTIGAAFSGSHFERADEMLQAAETAMHRGRARGGNTTEMFDPTMGEEVRSRIHLEGSMRHAIDRQEFSVHYQPIVALSTRQLVGFEALTRWRRSDGSYISPGEFIPVAEESGMINTLGEWVLSRACESATRWTQARRPPFVSINLSGKQLARPQIVDEVKAVLRRTRLTPSRLKLEITETALISNTDEVAMILDSLRELGLRLSLDDFGTGYSSLSYLHRFNFDTIKIDKSFVKDLGDGGSGGIIPTIIQLARTMRMDVIAEGVETEEQARLLLQMGCPFGQGFLFSRALPEDRLQQLLSLNSLRSFSDR